MAKRKMSVSFKNATIDVCNMTITEITKDDMKVYSLKDILSQFSEIDSVSLSISTDEEISEVEDEGEVEISD